MVEPMVDVGDGKVPGSLVEVVQKLVVEMLVEGRVDLGVSVVVVERKVDVNFSVVVGTVDIVEMLVEGRVDQGLSVVLVQRKVDENFSVVLGTVDICCSVVTVVDEGHGSSVGFLNGGWQQQIGCAKGVQINLGSEQLNTVVK